MSCLFLKVVLIIYRRVYGKLLVLSRRLQVDFFNALFVVAVADKRTIGAIARLGVALVVSDVEPFL